MSDEENKKRRRFDPSLGMPAGKLNPGVLSAMTQMLGGIGAGLGQGIAQRMNDRMLLAAAALQGILATDTGGKFTEVAAEARQFAAALLKELDEHPDPRGAKVPQVQQVEP